MNVSTHQEHISEHGFTVIDDIFTAEEVATIISCIQQVDTSNDTFRKTKDLFAIRQFLKEVPQVIPAVFNTTLNNVISRLFGADYKPVKSIYFDKPGESNWFVSYHQDLTISVKEKADVAGFGPWTVKQQQYAVQPPLNILENNFTIRIHLDDTDQDNGALRVVPGSHARGVYRPETIDWSVEKEITCNVAKGGIMIMRPLLLHASSRTTNHHKRRVIHIEFSNQSLPAPLQWSEML
jgi:ectoine hydroxylase-related dioxygenase (phytanoyl-CoA dioxygenase family)